MKEEDFIGPQVPYNQIIFLVLSQSYTEAFRGSYSRRVEIWGPHLLLIAPLGIVNMHTYAGLSWDSGQSEALPPLRY